MTRVTTAPVAGFVTADEVGEMWRRAIKGEGPRPDRGACERMAEHMNLRFFRPPSPTIQRQIEAYGVLIERYDGIIQSYPEPRQRLVEPPDEFAETANLLWTLRRDRERLKSDEEPSRLRYRRHAPLIWLLAKADMKAVGATPSQGGNGSRKTNAAVRFTVLALERLGYSEIKDGTLAAFLQQWRKDAGGKEAAEAMRDLVRLGLGVRLRRLGLRLHRVGLALAEKQRAAAKK